MNAETPFEYRRWHERRHYAQVSSTNDMARELAEAGAPSGTVVTADVQTNGRGRYGRRWLSKPGESVLMSVVLRPRIAADRLGMVAVAAALAVVEVIEALAPVATRIKWPNDVLIGDRKISGILIESKHRGHEMLEFIVLGVGVNVAQKSFPIDLSSRATSLLIETGRRYSRDDIAQGIVRSVSTYLDMLTDGGVEELRRRYEKRLCGMNENIVLYSPHQGQRLVTGVVRGIDNDGGILIDDLGGTRKTYYAGEVSTVPSQTEVPGTRP